METFFSDEIRDKIYAFDVSHLIYMQQSGLGETEEYRSAVITSGLEFKEIKDEALNLSEYNHVRFYEMIAPRFANSQTVFKDVVSSVDKDFSAMFESGFSDEVYQIPKWVHSASGLLLFGLIALFLPIAVLFLLLLIVGLHEAGHYWVSRRNGVEPRSFNIGFGPIVLLWRNSLGKPFIWRALPLGGYVQLDHIQHRKASPWSKLKISSAGVGVNLASGSIVGALFWQNTTSLGTFLGIFAYYSVLLGLFNLIPFGPLDGLQIFGHSYELIYEKFTGKKVEFMSTSLAEVMYKLGFVGLAAYLIVVFL